MGALGIPESPVFVDKSEEVVWKALLRSLGDDDVVLHGIRFTDDQAGDVEIDFLVLLADLGAVAIESKGGLITFADGEFHQTDAQESRTVDPVEQARNGIHALRRFVQSQPSWSRGSLRATWMVAFPYTQVNGDFGPEARRDTMIGQGDLVRIADCIVARLSGADIPARIPAAGWVDDLIELLRGAAHAPMQIVDRATLRRRHLDSLVEGHGKLLSFISPNPRYEVLGSAGTGKTLLAVEQARRWARAGERVCLVTYGRGVAAVVSDIFTGQPHNRRPAFIGTFHQLGQSWGVTLDKDDPEHIWIEEAPQRMIKAASLLESGQRYTAFVVDEAQDFADSWWDALLMARRGDDYKLAIFRDDEQDVFTNRLGRPQEQLVAFRLEENLRNATPIVDSFRPLVETNILARSGRGIGVMFAECEPGDEIEVADDIVDSLLTDGWLPEHVALLTTRHRHPVQREYHDKSEYWADYFDAHLVFYSTVSGFKGLERPVIVLAVDGFHEGIDPRSVLYTGMSRAQDLLVIVADPAVILAVGGENLLDRLRRETDNMSILRRP